MDAELKIKIGADVSEVTSGINKAQESLKKLAPASNSATTALGNLSRVAQDAPFGFIAISNNLDPLFNSFTQLRQQTGSLGGAFKALGAQLAGPAGIALGFSVVVSVITTAINKYGSLSAAANALLGDTSALATAQRELNASYASAEASVAGEIAAINSLIRVARDQTISREAQQEAIDVLNKKYSEYLPTLTRDNVATEQATQAVDRLSQALIRQAKIKGIQELITKESEKQAKALLAGVEAIKNQDNLLNQFINTVRGAGQGSQVGLIRELNSLEKEADKSTETINLLTGALDNLTKQDAVEGTLFVEKPKKVKELRQEVVKLNDALNNIKPARILFPEDLQKIREIDNVFNGISNDRSTGLGAERLPQGFNDSFIELAEASFNARTELNKTQLELDILSEKANNTANTVVGALSPAFDAFFNSLATGSKSPFKAFGDAIKQLIAQLAAAAAKALIFRAIITAINPAGAAAAPSFLSLFSQFSGFNFGNSANRVNTGNITGSAAQFGGGVIVGELRGSTLALSLQRTNKSFGI